MNRKPTSKGGRKILGAKNRISQKLKRKRGRSPRANWQLASWIAAATAFVLVDMSIGRASLSAFPFVPSSQASGPAAIRSIFSSSGASTPPAQINVHPLQILGLGEVASSDMRQGARLSINGRPVSGQWNRQGSAIRVADYLLMQSLGLELLSTRDVTQQPVSWFSAGASDLSLDTAFDGQFRYLDVRSLAEQQGWGISVQGDVLQIETPSSRVLDARHGRQTWGDRLVIDLERPAPFQTDINSGSVTVTMDAVGPAQPLTSIHGSSAQAIASSSLATRGRQSVLQVGFSPQYQARVWTVSSPPRLIVDIHSGQMADKDIQWQPGLWWRQRTITVGSSQFPVTWLEIDPNQPALTLKPIWTNPSAMQGIAPLAATAQRWQAVAAINGGFFNRNNQLPLGAIRRQKEWISGPILNRGVVAWNGTGNLSVGRLNLQETIRLMDGRSFPSLHLNSGFVQAGLSRYTPAWGASYTPLTDFETLITVQNNRVTNKQLIESAGSAQVAIPADGYILAARSFRTAADAMPIGSQVLTESAAIPAGFEQYADVMGAGPLLIQNRQIVLNARQEGFSAAFSQQAAARSAIARSQSNTILLATVMRRVGGPGPTLAEMGHILYQLGATDALNLDGGTSTSLYLGGQIINRPSRTAARVHNAIGVFIEP